MSIALGYGRKSFVRNRIDTLSVDKQRLYVAERADQRGESLDWFEDAEGHRSGRHERTRPGYQRLLARLQNDPAVRSVIFYELDRAARSVISIDRVLKLCQQKDVAFICIKEGIDTSRGLGANEITRIQLLAVLAEGEANRVAERMSDTARYYRDQLHIPWGMWPFGVARTGEGEGARFQPDPPHDVTVRRLLTLYADGHGYHEAARALNTLGYFHVDRYGRQKSFSVETVRTIVGNVLFYAGYAVGVKFKAKQARITLAGEGTFLERYARAMRATRSPAITPLIDEGLASAVIERRHANLHTGRKPGDWVALLTPIVHWHGKKLLAQTKHHTHYYRTRGAGGVAFDADPIEATLIGRMRQITFPPAMRADIRRAVEETIGASRRAELARQEAKVVGEMELLYDLLSNGHVDRAVYNKRYATVEAQLRDVRRQQQAPDDVDLVMGALDDFAAAVDRMTARQRKQALQHLFERVDLDDAGNIERLHLRAWAKPAFAHVAAAMVTIMPPVSTDHDDVTRHWFVKRAA